MRSRARDVGFRAYHGVYRGTLTKSDDAKRMQEVEITGNFGEKIKDIEHWQPYGWTMNPLPPEGKDSQETHKAAEIITANVGSNRDHPVILGIADRRYRMRDLEPGEVGQHDHQHQRMHITKDGIDTASPKKVVSRTVKKGSGEKDKDASSKKSRDAEKSKTSITQLADGTITLSSNNDEGVSQASIVMKSDGSILLKGKVITQEAETETVTKAPSVYLGDKSGAKLVHRKGDLDSGGDAAVESATKVYAL